MLADPFGNRTMAGQSPMPGQGRVQFLVEVADPSEAAKFGYKVNGITLSDFYTPNYFDPLASPGVRYSYTGAIQKPRQVLNGGYLSWHDPVSDHWFQETWFTGSKSKFRDLGVLTAKNGSLRVQIDALTWEDASKRLQFKKRSKRASLTAVAATATNESSMHDKSTASRASSLRSQIVSVRSTAKRAFTAKIKAQSKK